MALTASLIGRGTTGGNSITTAGGTSAGTATFACLVSYDATAGAITTATDNKGNTYTAVGTAQADGNGGLLRWYVCENGTGGAGHTFTFTTASNNFGVAHLLQVASDAGGIPRLDINVQGQDTVGQPWDTVATGTLGYANEVILGAVACNVGGTAAYASSNMTVLSSEGDTSSFWTSGVAALNQAGTGTFTPSFTKTDAGGGSTAGLSHITLREETSGNASASGVTVTAAASLITGSAVGDGAASAAGVTLTAAASLIAGAADNGAALLYFRAFPRVRGGAALWSDESPASTLLLQETFGDPVAGGDATAAGVTLVAAASLIAGSASGIRNGTAAGVTLVAAASLIAGSAGNAPELGAYTYIGQEEGSGTDPATTSAITTTASGSSYLTLRAGYASNNSRPTDSKGNRWRHMGGATYTGWAGVFDAQAYVAQNGTGGSGHTLNFEKDANPTGEITVPLIEAKAGATRLVDWSLVNITVGNPLTAGSVTVTGPALLVAVWLGDAGGLTHTASPNNSFSNFISFGSLPPNSAVQMFCASRQVSAAGTYDVTWTETPDQGAILILAAFGEAGPNGYAPEEFFTASASLIAGSASGNSSATANGTTVTAAASLITGSANGGALAAGVTLPAAASLITGTANGGALAAGVTLPAAASLITGTANGGAVASGTTVTAAASLIAGTANGGALAAGATLPAAASLIAGTAHGGALAAGATLIAAASLIPGTAVGAGGGTAAGVTLAAAASLITGTATGGAVGAGVTLTTAASLIPGSAVGAGGGTAAGVTVTAAAALLPGSATGGAVAAGTVLPAAAALLAGAASGTSVAPGATLVAAGALLRGEATGGAVAAGQALLAVAALIAGAATGAGPITRGRVTVSAARVGNATLTATRVSNATATATGITTLEVDDT